jgi:Protein of unknown function (DUF2510)
VPMKDGQPPGPGLYEDPGGQAGLRYWDGTQWSPLLPSDVGKPTIGAKSPASWLVLPKANEHWTYAATRTRRRTASFAVFTAVSVVLLTCGLVIDQWWDRGTYYSQMSAVWLWIIGGSAALYALIQWRNRKFFRKLDSAANSYGRAMAGAATASPDRADANV